MRVPYITDTPFGWSRQYGGYPTHGVIDDQGRPKINVNRKNKRVSRMVCEAFHGKAPFAHAVVMHIDDNPANNRPENLKWGTQKENLNAPAFIDYCKSRTGENSPVIKGRKVA